MDCPLSGTSSGEISELRVSSDYRQVAARYALLVELPGDPGEFLGTLWGDAPSRFVLNLKDSRVGKIGVPRVRVVRLGTSGDLKRMEGQDDGGALWQVKVPVIIWGESGRAWLEERVMFDI